VCETYDLAFAHRSKIPAVEGVSEFLAADGWQVEGKRRIVGHGGCGGGLIREATRPNTDLLRESASPYIARQLRDAARRDFMRIIHRFRGRAAATSGTGAAARERTNSFSSAGHPQGDGGANRRQACDETPSQALAAHPHRVAVACSMPLGLLFGLIFGRPGPPLSRAISSRCAATVRRKSATSSNSFT
jgi:hypothetical protein